MRQVMADINERGLQDEMNVHFHGTRHSIQSPAHSTVSPARLVPQKRGANTQLKTKVTRACDFCKARKSKCSGDKPCVTCHQRRLECTYESTYSRGRPPSPIRTARHRRALSETQQRMQMEVEPLSQTDSVNLPTRHGDIVPEAPSRASPGLEVAGQYSEPTSGLSFLIRAWRRITNTETSQLVGDPQSHVEEDQLLRCAGDKPLPVSCQIRTPSVTRGQELLDSYFTVCIATYRMLHRPTAERWLVVVLENGMAGRPLFVGVGRGRAAVVLSLLAVASFHEEKARGELGSLERVTESTNATSDELFMEAANLSATETGFPRLESAQSHLIQVLFLLMSCRFNQAWYTFGHALQIISALGLHRKGNRDTSKRLKHDYIEEQCRRRTFWVAYILDKYISVIFGRPRHYHDDDIDQYLPEPINDEDMTSEGPSGEATDDCHIDSLIHHAKLAMIAERISREVYSIKPIPDQERFASSHRLGVQLRKWKADLPPFLGAINPNSLIPSFRRQANALKLSYCHALLLTYRPLLLQSPARQSAEQANLAECIAAAGAVLDSADCVAQEGPLFNAYWWTHYICFCALVVVYVWAIQQSGNDANLRERLHMLEKAERCLSHLAQATATNSPSRRYSIILQELRAEAKRKTARPTQDRVQEPEQSPAANLEAARQLERVDPEMWDSLFGSPIEAATPGLQNFLENWQTIDWLQLDSSAFGLIPEIDPAFRF